MAAGKMGVSFLRVFRKRKPRMKGTNRHGKTASTTTTTRADRFDVIISGEINVILCCRRRVLAFELFNGRKYSVLKSATVIFPARLLVVAFPGLRA